MSTSLSFEYPTLAGLPTGTIADLSAGQVAVFGASEATPTIRQLQATLLSHRAQSVRPPRRSRDS